MTDHLLRLTLKRRRRQLGLSQAAVAQLMGDRGRSWVCDLEAGRHQPRLDTLDLWCHVLGLRLTVVDDPTGGEPS